MHTPARLAYTLLVVSAPVFAATPYNLVQSYAGQSFFDGWDYEDGFDNTTNGAVNWLNQSAATAANLTFVSSSGQAFIRVDDTTNLPNVTVVTEQLKRNSVSLSSHDFFSIGTVFVFDAAHIPTGCSVWPAFWTRGPNWPNGGEIDILENVNLATDNQMALHTTPGCTQTSDVTQSGKTTQASCSFGANSSNGCTVVESQANSFGSGFNNAGGGVWATQFDTSGIFIWFWTRDSVPSDLSASASSVDPSTWGTPSASWPSSICNSSLSTFFTPQQLVLDITLCGDFAGEPTVYAQTCAKPGETVVANTCYADNVNGTGADYAEAFFQINYVNAYSLNNSILQPSVSAGSTVLGSATTSATSGSSTGTSSTGSGSSSGAQSSIVGASVLGATVLAAFAWALM